MVAPSIKRLRRLAYKKIFEKLNYDEEVILDRGLSFYAKIDLTDKEIESLIAINQLLIDNSDGKFGEMKDKCARLKMDYKKIYGL